MVDQPEDGPLQAPTLTELEEARARSEMARRATLESLMASPDAPDVAGLLAELVNRPAWHRRAACRGMGRELFFPERGAQRWTQALAVCETCPVRSECLASALQDPSTPGIWGGTTGRERRQLRRGVA